MKLVFKIVLPVAALAVFIGAWLLNAKIGEVQIYQVKKGVGFAQVSRELHSVPLLILSKIMQTRLQAGYYQINQNMSVLGLLKNFEMAQVKTTSIRLVEGKTVQQYFTQLNQNEALNNRQTVDGIMQSIDIEKPYEGKFFADTYWVDYGNTAQSVFARAHQTMMTKVESLWQGRAQNLPLKTPYELIILASLIEKESANVAEKPMIASVFVNRLNQGMRLQTDPTVIYALGDGYTGKLSRVDLKFNSPFNTYQNKGLPPSAIASPSLSSLTAASQPAVSQNLYFVAKKDGSHVFAKTYQQHRLNIKKYLK